MVVATSPVEKYVRVKLDHFPRHVGVKSKNSPPQSLPKSEDQRQLKASAITCAQHMAFVFSLPKKNCQQKKKQPLQKCCTSKTWVW